MQDKTGKLSSFFRLNQPSALLLVLPYFVFNYREFFQSPFFNVYYCIGVLALLVAVEAGVRWIWRRAETWPKLPLFVFLAGVIVLFYGYYFVSNVQHFVIRNGMFPVRMRTLFILLLVLLTLLQWVGRRKKWLYTGLNLYLILFSLLAVLFPEKKQNQAEVPIQELKAKPVLLGDSISESKPVVLIIADEYHSPDGLFTIFKDSSLYSFSRSLQRKGWQVRNHFPSAETSTIHSISSLLNFNLSAGGQYGNQSLVDVGLHKLSKPAVVDSLQAHQVQVVNYGIFDLGSFPALSKLYFYPSNLKEHLLLYTTYYVMKFNTGGFNLDGFQNTYSPWEEHCKKLLSTLPDTLARLASPRSFVYAHLMMPHAPMQFSPEFPLRLDFNLPNYRDYWNFTNQKLEALLDKLTRENKYRIILTGDHGFKTSDKLDPKASFAAFYGFSPESVARISEVQDLGSLVFSALR